jgi:hypothetical protein
MPEFEPGRSVASTSHMKIRRPWTKKWTKKWLTYTTSLRYTLFLIGEMILTTGARFSSDES